MEYQVIVGNLGTVYSGPSRRMAQTTYAVYVKGSKKGYCRYWKEPVTLIAGDEIADEFSYPDWQLARMDMEIERLEAELRTVQAQRDALVAEMEG